MPVLLCSVPGYDASGRVEDMAVEMNKSVTPIAIGIYTHFYQIIDKALVIFVCL